MVLYQYLFFYLKVLLKRYSALYCLYSLLDLEKASIIKEQPSPIYGGVYDYYLNFQSGILIWKDNIFFEKVIDIIRIIVKIF